MNCGAARRRRRRVGRHAGERRRSRGVELAAKQHAGRVEDVGRTGPRAVARAVDHLGHDAALGDEPIAVGRQPDRVDERDRERLRRERLLEQAIRVHRRAHWVGAKRHHQGRAPCTPATRRSRSTACRRSAPADRWPLYFLVASSFWNFLGAGVFGFINLPLVNYYEHGTYLDHEPRPRRSVRHLRYALDRPAPLLARPGQEGKCGTTSC